MTIREGEGALQAALRSWIKGYRADARRDRHHSLKKRIEEIGYSPDMAPEVVENIIDCVTVVCSYMSIGCAARVGDFLRLQTYDPAANGARYFVRVESPSPSFLVVNELRELDLADLFSSPLSFIHLYLEHVDAQPFSPEETAELEEAIRDDLYFDYQPDEITLEIESSAGGIFVSVCDADREPPWRI